MEWHGPSLAAVVSKPSTLEEYCYGPMFPKEWRGLSKSKSQTSITHNKNEYTENLLSSHAGSVLQMNSQ